MRLEEQKSIIIGELISARSRILQAAIEIPDERAEEIFLGSWSIHHLLAHLIGWDLTNLQAIQEILEGKPPSFFNQYDPDWQTYNQSLIEQYLRPSLADLLVDVQASHLKLTEYLGSISAMDIMHGKVKRESGRIVTVRNLLRVEARDETKHAEQIVEHFF